MISLPAKRLLLTTTLAGLLLTGCSAVGDQEATDGDEVETAAEGSAAPSDGDGAPADGGTNDDAPAPAQEVEETSAAEGPECLVGDWRISEDEMQRFYNSMDTPAEFAITGDTGLRFTEDTYEYTPDFTLEMQVAGQNASGTMTGSISGSYTTDAGIVTTSNEDHDTHLELTVGGVAVDGTETGEGFLDASPVNSAPYECTPDGPVLTFQNTGDGVDIQLTPNS